MIKISSLHNKYIYFVFRLALGMIFIWASFDKILNPAEFTKIVYNYRILPDFAINIFGILLPWLEFICGIFLVIGFNTRSSSLILSILLIVFIIAILAAIYRGLDISCGCFDTDPSESSKVGFSLLFRDILMLCNGIYLFLLPDRFLSVQGTSKQRV